LNKILIFIGNLDTGGAERVVSTLANQWAMENFEITLCLTTNNIVKFNIHKNVKINSLPQSCNLLHKLLNIRALIKQNSAKNVISFLPHINILVLIASLFLKKNIIISERIHPKFYKKFYFIRILRFFLYGICTKIVFQTESSRNSLFYLGKNKNNEYVIPNPCDEKFINSSIAYENKLIINVGRFTQQKRQSLLINIFSEIHKNNNDWKLLIVGSGELKPLLVNQIIKLNLTESVQLLDSTTDLLELYKKASIFSLTSEFEGFPNTLMEAMAMGLPSISFDCLSGPRELTNDGENSFLINMNNLDEYKSGLEILIKSNEIRKQIGIASKRSIKNRYRINVIIEEWNNLLLMV
jgi:GalNAc-alpha-(1->4)-GalNAc-alpha-(1->3)-diNAcBac-PP-undecaprenol alpha-1,4-N-acetyl-D-galactosaminyltransferase